LLSWGEVFNKEDTTAAQRGAMLEGSSSRI
jgi:hypothetical protein